MSLVLKTMISAPPLRRTSNPNCAVTGAHCRLLSGQSGNA